MSYSQRNYSFKNETYQHGGHSHFKSKAHYSEKGNGEEWLNECIKQCSKNQNIKCISYNTKTNSAFYHKHYIPENVVNEQTYKTIELKRTGKLSERYKWHVFVVFD